MAEENRQRISLYLEPELVVAGDQLMRAMGLSSRNQLYAQLLKDRLLTNVLEITKKDLMKTVSESVREVTTNYLADKVSQTLEKSGEENRHAIASGFFRYAVQMEMVIRILADLSDVEDCELDYIRKAAVENVKRMHGQVSVKDILKKWPRR